MSTLPSDNELTGTVPAELGNLSNLKQLWLHDNRLTGELPAELGNLTNLEELIFRGNEFTGCIPHPMQGVYTNDLATLGLEFCDYAPIDPTEEVTGLCSETPRAGSTTTESEVLSDCHILLQTRDVLAGTSALNWSANIPVTAWKGVRLDGSQSRVLGLKLNESGLTGEIPTMLGHFTRLEACTLILGKSHINPAGLAAHQQRNSARCSRIAPEYCSG